MPSTKLWLLSVAAALLACLVIYTTHSAPSRDRTIHSLSWNLRDIGAYIFGDASASSSSLPKSVLTIPTNCSSPLPHTCTFYAACLEPHFHCGPTGYPLGFGEKFCTKFALPSNVGRLSPKGQTWMWSTMSCLQKALVPELDKPGSSDPNAMDACKSLEDKAFSTHAPCYLSSGLCSLSPEDWLVIVEIIDLKTLLSSWDAFDGGVEAAEGCLKFFTQAAEGK